MCCIHSMYRRVAWTNPCEQHVSYMARPAGEQWNWKSVVTVNVDTVTVYSIHIYVDQSQLLPTYQYASLVWNQLDRICTRREIILLNVGLLVYSGYPAIPWLVFHTCDCQGQHQTPYTGVNTGILDIPVLNVGRLGTVGYWSNIVSVSHLCLNGQNEQQPSFPESGGKDGNVGSSR